MKKYHITFTGRTSGAIGITYGIGFIAYLPENLTGEELEKAINEKVYEKYEHISNLHYEVIA